MSTGEDSGAIPEEKRHQLSITAPCVSNSDEAGVRTCWRFFYIEEKTGRMQLRITWHRTVLGLMGYVPP